MTLNHLKHLTLALSIAAALGACKKEEAAAPVAAAPAAPALTIDFSKLPALPAFNVADLDANAAAGIQRSARSACRPLAASRATPVAARADRQISTSTASR